MHIFCYFSEICEKIGEFPSRSVEEIAKVLIKTSTEMINNIFNCFEVEISHSIQSELLNLAGIVLENLDMILIKSRISGISESPSIKELPGLLIKMAEFLDNHRSNLDTGMALRNLCAKVRDSVAILILFCSREEVDEALKQDLEKSAAKVREMTADKKKLAEGCFTYGSRKEKLVIEEIGTFEKESLVELNPERNIRFCLSSKNKTLMLMDNFLLRIGNISKKAIRWRCINDKCKFSASTHAGAIIETTKEHNHESNQDDYTKNVLRSRIKQKAFESLGTPLSVIVQEEVAFEEYRNLHLHGTTQSLKKMGRRVRVKNQPKFTELKSFSDLKLKEEMFFEDESKRESLLLYDNKKKDHRIIVIGKKSHLKLLSESQIWIGDGTFKTSPKAGSQSFGQLYTIAGSKSGKLFVFLRVLMERRQKVDYSDLFQWIRNSIEDNNWELSLATLLTDFELAPHAAKLLVYGENVNSKGCRFHFGQNVMKELGKYSMFEFLKYFDSKFNPLFGLFLFFKVFSFVPNSL